MRSPRPSGRKTDLLPWHDLLNASVRVSTLPSRRGLLPVTKHLRHVSEIRESRLTWFGCLEQLGSIPCDWRIHVFAALRGAVSGSLDGGGQLRGSSVRNGNLACANAGPLRWEPPMLEPPQAGEQMRARPRQRQPLALKKGRAPSLGADGCGRAPYLSPPSLDAPVLAASFELTGPGRIWQGYQFSTNGAGSR